MTPSRPLADDNASWDVLLERLAQRLTSLHERLNFLTNRGPRPGTIWSTYPENEEDPFGPLMLIVANAPTAKHEWCALKVMQDPETDCEDRRYLDKEKSGLHFSCAVFLDPVVVLNSNRLISCAGEVERDAYKGILSAVVSRKHCTDIKCASRGCNENKEHRGPL
jgi:hypothetical protein